MSRATLFVITIISILGLAACGKKGPLEAPRDLDGQKTTSKTEKTTSKSSDFLLD